jgi:RNA polymerase sigma factor (sigma-70 family)
MVPRSIDETVEVDEGPLGGRQVGPLAELLADPLSDADYDRVVDRVAGRQLEALLTRLTLIEREVLRARYGLDGGKPRTQKQVAERLGLSVGRVRQIERRALGKLAREVGEQDGGEAEPGGVRPGAGAQQGQAGRARRA